MLASKTTTSQCLCAALKSPCGSRSKSKMHKLRSALRASWALYFQNCVDVSKSVVESMSVFGCLLTQHRDQKGDDGGYNTKGIADRVFAEIQISGRSCWNLEALCWCLTSLCADVAGLISARPHPVPMRQNGNGMLCSTSRLILQDPLSGQSNKKHSLNTGAFGRSSQWCTCRLIL